MVIDKTWIPDLPKGSDNYRFGWIRDTPIRLQIQRNEPCNLSTTNPLVINLAAARLTSPRRLTLGCESKNTSKCTERQPNHRKQLIQLTSGVPQPKNDVLFLTEMNKAKPNPRGGGGGCIRRVWGGQDPLVATLVGQDKIHGPKDQRQWHNTETGSGHQLVEYFPVYS
jgi:hypothetical protein